MINTIKYLVTRIINGQSIDMNFSFIDKSQSLRMIFVGICFFLSFNLMAQNCPLSTDVQYEVKNGCGGQNNGQIVFTFDKRVEGTIENRVGLYLKDQSMFLRNRVNTSDLKIEGREISYNNLPSGVYQIAVYFEDCPDFPKPTMYPSEGVIVTNEEDCGQ